MTSKWDAAVCKFCARFEAALRAKDNAMRAKSNALLNSQANDSEIWRKEADLQALCEARERACVDPDSGFAQLLALAENGSVWSMLLVGYAYQVGQGAPVDEIKAEAWYRRAFEGGCDRAIIHLGHFYFAREDWAKAEEVLRAGVERKLSLAKFRLAWVYLERSRSTADARMAQSLLQEASAEGDCCSKQSLGVLTLKGRFGIFNVPKGIRLLADLIRVIPEPAENIRHSDQLSKDDASLSPIGQMLAIPPVGAPG